MLKNKKDLAQTKILWSTLAWIVGLAIIFIIWTILAATVYKKGGVLPNVGKCFTAFGEQLAKGTSWAAMGIAFGQTLACFIGCLMLATGCVLLTRYFKKFEIFLMPFITLSRALPTQIIMILIAVWAINILWLVPIIVAFFIIFPMMYEGINNAFNNINKHQIEMANVFKVSKWNQFRQLYLPIALPYIFSAMVAAFGLTFKVTIASQYVQTTINNGDPSFSSIGIIIRDAMKKGQYDTLVAWGMITIMISLVCELIIKEIGRICMPHKYKDQVLMKNFFHKIFGRRNDQVK